MNKFSSIFGQILQIFSKREFYEAVMETEAEKRTKGFTCWDQFVAMIFCQLGQVHSLREICGGLATCLGKLKHLGINDAPCRSTLSYANEHRPWQLYEKLFYRLLDRCKPLASGKHKFRFKNKLYSLDATLIELCVASLTGRNTGRPRERSSSISFWIMKATSLSLPISQKAMSMR